METIVDNLDNLEEISKLQPEKLKKVDSGEK
jgi:hypothetical protein